MTDAAVLPHLFERPTLEVARQLLGVKLSYRGCSGIIVETEAYTDDPASHWITRPITGRLLGESFGLIYIYTIYGVHRCLNVTTDSGAPGAVLIRAIKPVSGLNTMRERRGKDEERALASGPAKLVQAFGIDLSLNGKPVLSHLELQRAVTYDDDVIERTPRIGISQGKELNWRFCVRGSPYLSR